MTIFNTVAGNSAAAGSVTITQNGSYDVSSYAQAIVDVSGGGSVGPYVVGNNTSANTYTISPVIAGENDTVTVKYTGSSQPLMPGMAFAVTDASGNVVVTLKSSGMMTQNETWTFTMPGYSVVIAFVANM